MNPRRQRLTAKPQGGFETRPYGCPTAPYDASALSASARQGLYMWPHVRQR